MTKEYKKAALGGTFDHFHAGHQSLVGRALELAETGVIGVVENPQIKDYPAILETLKQRQNQLLHWLALQGSLPGFELTPLSDIYGPTLVDPQIDVLVVSEDTQSGAATINRERVRLHLPQLPVSVVPMVTDETGLILSSTRIRAGVVNRQGLVYQLLFQNPWRLKPEFRDWLKAPFGLITPLEQVISEAHDRLLVCVGDLVTQKLASVKNLNTVAVVDGLIQRQPVGIPEDNYGFAKVLTASNLPGTIQPEAATGMAQLFTSPGLIKITGEEDLLVIPAVLLTPLGSLVLYGQPGNGLVKLTVTENLKQEIMNLLTSVFEKS